MTRKSFVINTMTSSDGCAMTYDAAGNQTYDCVGTHSYDAENRMTKAVQLEQLLLLRRQRKAGPADTQRLADLGRPGDVVRFTASKENLAASTPTIR
ncbi:MAG: hypothetical protein IPL01_21785 [Acidobacteria bacterium]|nr:hypothetical protein [Acidobacteriota bacterium]